MYIYQSCPVDDKCFRSCCILEAWGLTDAVDKDAPPVAAIFFVPDTRTDDTATGAGSAAATHATSGARPALNMAPSMSRMARPGRRR